MLFTFQGRWKLKVKKCSNEKCRLFTLLLLFWGHFSFLCQVVVTTVAYSFLPRPSAMAATELMTFSFLGGLQSACARLMWLSMDLLASL